MNELLNPICKFLDQQSLRDLNFSRTYEDKASEGSEHAKKEHKNESVYSPAATEMK